MIIFNTTYCMDKRTQEEALLYLKEVYIPAALGATALQRPRLSRVLGADEEEAASYSLQFDAADVEELERWYHTEGAALHRALTERFGERITAFATLLQPIDIEQ